MMEIDNSIEKLTSSDTASSNWSEIRDVKKFNMGGGDELADESCVKMK
jgi:hypothetical protein